MSAVSNVHMKIEGSESGEIKGESRIKGFAGWIELDEWDWAIGFEAPPEGKGKGNRSEEAVPSVLSFDKLMDCASTGMLSAMTNGEMLTVTISMLEASDNPFGLDILLEDARLTEYDAKFKSEDKSVLIEESWVIDYRKINFAYRVGSRAGPQVVLERPAWATTDKPKGNKGPDDEVIKLTENLSPAALNDLWAKMQEAAAKKRVSPKKDEG